METTSSDEGGAVRMAGRRLSETETRKWHRWRAGASPSFFVADRWTVSVVGVHIQEFLDWARENGRAVWALAEPWFETEPLSLDDIAYIAAVWPMPAGEPEDWTEAWTGPLSGEGTDELPRAA